MNMETFSFTLLDFDLSLVFSYLSVVFLRQTFISSRFPFHTLSEMFVPSTLHIVRVSHSTLSVIVMCRLQMLKQREQALSALDFHNSRFPF